MKLNLTSQKVMWAVMILIALTALPSILAYMQRFVVRNGVVTAFRYEVHAPIDGVVNNLSVFPGDIPGEKPALLLGNSRKIGQYETLEEELASLEQSLKKNEKTLEQYLEKVTSDLDQSLAILKARLVGETAMMSESQKHRTRTLKLVEASVATPEDGDKAEAEFREDQSKVNTTQLEIKQLKHRQQMIAQGMLPNDVSDGALQVQQRINILHKDILACKRKMSEAQTDFTNDEISLEAIESDVNTRSTSASVSLPDTAVIWELDVQEGMEVTKGDRLLSYIDRSRLMVEIAIDDATLELIDPGHPVRVRLYGRPGFIDGKVTRVMGSAGIWHSNLFAAAVKLKSPREGTVLVQIEDDRLYDDVERFCGVGRTVYAEFEGVGLWEQYFGVFLR